MNTAWIALSLVPQIGAHKLHALLATFGDAASVLNADTAALCQVTGIGVKTAAAIRALNVDEIERALTRWRAAGVRVVTWHDPDYPPRLKAFPDAPPVLFMRGNWQLATPQPAVAIVGTRTPTPLGSATATHIGMLLAKRGYLVVSGLALGIDSAAHMGAFVANSPTIALLGSGVLNIYPSANRDLADQMMANGAIIAEVRPDASPKATHLVARNRLISGMSDALIVVETRIDGGAMHAVRKAQAQHKPVYVCDFAMDGNQALIDAGIPILSDTLDNFRLA